jgi:hypothetical protein
MLKDYRVQREHERDMEVRSFELDTESFRAFARYQTLQLVAVAVIAVLIASGGIVLAAAGKPVAGLAVLVGEIAALVLAFYGRQARGSDNEEPRSDDPPPLNP